MTEILTNHCGFSSQDCGWVTELLCIQHKSSAFITLGSLTLLTLPFLSSLLISTLLLHKNSLSLCDPTCQDNTGAHSREDRLSPLQGVSCLFTSFRQRVWDETKKPPPAFVGRRKAVERCENKRRYICCWFCLIIGTMMPLCSRKFQNFQS